jgi:arylsulfatase A-like enzyme
VSWSTKDKPNVLFIITDQHRADHVGFGGNSVVSTVHLDALASRSTIFDRAYVANPVCMPNRSSIMTGRMPSAHGVIFNDRSLSPDANTFVGQLRKVGYQTALIGKSHLQHGMSREAIADLPGDSSRDSLWVKGWDTVEHQERYENGDTPKPDDFYGFAHIELTLGHGAWTGGHHYQWARERGATHEQLVAGYTHNSDVQRRSPSWWQIHDAPFPEELYSTSFVTERTISFIESASRQKEPWMVWCSFPDPHHPLSPPARWLDRHDPDDIVLPESFTDPGEDWPRHVAGIRRLDPDDHNFVRPFGPTPELARAAIAATYGMIEYVDEGVGKILATLARLGIEEDTIVIFTSDHGDMMGDHGLMLKGGMHFQGCLRVPLTIHVPGNDAARTSSFASSLDLAQTILELCDVTALQGMQGKSLMPILSDPHASVRTHVLVEDDFPPSEGRGVMPLKIRTVLSDLGRYTRDTNSHEQLFQLDNDPHEMINLAVQGRDPGRRSEMVSQLVDAMMAADDIARVEPVSQ